MKRYEGQLNILSWREDLETSVEDVVYMRDFGIYVEVAFSKRNRVRISVDYFHYADILLAYPQFINLGYRAIVNRQFIAGVQSQQPDIALITFKAKDIFEVPFTCVGQQQMTDLLEYFSLLVREESSLLEYAKRSLNCHCLSELREDLHKKDFVEFMLRLETLEAFPIREYRRACRYLTGRSNPFKNDSDMMKYLYNLRKHYEHNN